MLITATTVQLYESLMCQRKKREWKKQESTLLKLPKSKRACHGKKANYASLEEDLATWVTAHCQDGNIIFMLLMIIQAKKLSKDVKYTV